MTLTDEKQAVLFTTNALMCSLCLDGIGQECHTPGCVFYLCATPRTDLGTLRQRFEGAGHTLTNASDAAGPSPKVREVAAKLISLGEGLRGACVTFLKQSDPVALAHGEFLLEQMHELGCTARRLDDTPLETEEMLPKCIECGWVVFGLERCPSCGGRVLP